MSEQYTYAVARIRALEVGLFSNSTIDQLIACQDYGQCLQFLEEKGWGDSESSGNGEAILNKEEEKIWDVVKDLHIDMENFAVLSYPKLFHNLKAAIKEVCTSEKNRHIYYDDVSVPGEEMRGIVEEKEFGKLPAYMQHAAEEAYEALLHTGTDSYATVSLTGRRLTPSTRPENSRTPLSFVIMRSPQSAWLTSRSPYVHRKPRSQ